MARTGLLIATLLVLVCCCSQQVKAAPLLSFPEGPLLGPSWYIRHGFLPAHDATAANTITTTPSMDTTTTSSVVDEATESTLHGGESLWLTATGKCRGF